MLVPASVENEMERAEVGPYSLLERLGEGGFGVVYRAEQEEPIKREVALKIVKAGMDTAAVIRRFEAERQALAIMNHPGIAKVFDAGVTKQGRPYFVMELVEGATIVEFCQQRKLTLRARLELFADVCLAVHHAHQKGIIHRDLKPSNILVVEGDKRALPKVIDFGIAKALHQRMPGRTADTLEGKIIGTPEYMSPEQAALGSVDVDTRSDVYSLGVILYELLAGTSPFGGDLNADTSAEKMLQLIREKSPQKPSTKITRHNNLPELQVRRLGADLDWITMKALEKDRDRRYDSAKGLAEDIGRFLKDQPVEARRPSKRYLLQRFAKRHRMAISIAAAFMVTLLAALAFSIRQTLIATEAKTRATTSAEVAKQQLKVAQYERNTARQISDLLKKTLGNPHPELGESVATVPELLDLVEREVEKRFKDRPDIQLELFQTIAKTYQGIGQYKGNLRILDRLESLAFLDMESGLVSGKKFAAVAVTDLAHRNYDIGRFDVATRLYQEVREKVSVEKDRESYVETSLGLARIARRQGPSKSVGYFREAFEAFPSEVENENPRYLSAMYELGSDLARLDQLDEAMPLLLKAYELTARSPDTPEAFWSMRKLVEAYKEQGKLDEADLAVRESYRRFREVLGANHQNSQDAAETLAELYLPSRAGEVGDFFRDHLSAVKSNSSGLNPGRLRAMLLLGRVLRDLPEGKAEAEKILKKLYEGSRELLGKSHHSTLLALSDWAKVSGNETAFGLLDEAISGSDGLQSSIDPATMGSIIRRVAERQLNNGNLVEAERLYRQSFELVRQHFGPNDLNTLMAQRNLAYACFQHGKRDEAIQLITPALKEMEQTIGKDNPITKLTREYAKMFHANEENVKKN